MNPIKALMGRRQFLIATGLASGCALTCKKLSGFQTGLATAADRAVKAGAGTTTNKFPNLLSPIKVRNVMVKNRMLYTVARPHFLEGPETYPGDLIRAYYSDIAKNAAIVTVRMSTGRGPRSEMRGDSAHMASWDGDDPAVHNYIDQLIEGVHCEGALVSGANAGGSTVEEAVTNAKELEDKGYDVVYVGTRGAQNREELAPIVEQMQAVRKATNLIILAWVLPVTPGESRGGSGPGGGDPSGPSVEELVAMAKMLEGAADIIQIRDGGGYSGHPNSFIQEKDKPLTLTYAQAIKESGVKILTAPNGGFRDPASNEEFIASGKTDMIALARPFICDPEYVKKAYEGRDDDWVPCVMCNKCHGTSFDGPWITVCSVNPKLGLSSSVRSIQPPAASKKVAVIGGGPSGMKAAITAAERGHKVTLYEKNGALGGLLRHSDYSPLKWAYKDFKDYLVRQTYKAGVEVLLNTEATPKMLRAKGYDTILAALGAEPVVSSLPGADGKNVWDVINAYSDEKAMGKNVVVIGGGDFGTETGMFLANAGHKVTALTSENEMMQRGGPHNKEPQMDLYQKMDNFSYKVKVTATGISQGKVTYRDATGAEKTIQADSVVVYPGLRPRLDEALEFTDSADQVLLLGDCTGKAGTVQKTIRSAFFVASQV